jgi:hypothetical protein
MMHSVHIAFQPWPLGPGFGLWEPVSQVVGSATPWCMSTQAAVVRYGTQSVVYTRVAMAHGTNIQRPVLPYEEVEIGHWLRSCLG